MFQNTLVDSKPRLNSQETKVLKWKFYFEDVNIKRLKMVDEKFGKKTI